MRASLCGVALSLIAGCGASSEGTGAKGPEQSAGAAQGGSAGSLVGTAGAPVASGGTTSGSGGSAVAGSPAAAAGSPDDGLKPPPHVVVPCDAAPVGKWEEITPPDVLNSARYKSGTGYGVNAFVMDPTNTATITLGTDNMGVHRTTDCGATWTHINTGRSGKELDGGVQWTMSIDPVAPNTIYTVAGYGTNGVFKTTDGGQNWDQVLKPEYAKNFIYGGFTAQVRVDPTMHQHVVITPHFNCENGNSSVCFLETFDGGDTWKVVDNTPSSGEGARLLVVDRNTWFSGLGNGGLFRTSDGGKTWSQLTDSQSYAYEVHHRPGGKFYLPTAFGISQSNDGVTWTALDKAAGAHIITTSDKRIYASTGGFCVIGHSDAFNPIASAPIDDPTNWTVDTTYSNHFGAGDLQYDVDHHMLYASNCMGGFWRLRTE